MNGGAGGGALGDFKVADYVGKGVVKHDLQGTIVMMQQEKLELKIKSCLHRMADRAQWHTPLALLVGLVLPLFTANYVDFGPFDKAEWKAITVVASVVTCLWLGWALWKLKNAPHMSSEDVIAAILKDAHTETFTLSR